MLAYNVKFIYRGEPRTLCAIGTRADVDSQITNLEKQLGTKLVIKAVEPLVVMAQGEC